MQQVCRLRRGEQRLGPLAREQISPVPAHTRWRTAGCIAARSGVHLEATGQQRREHVGADESAGTGHEDTPRRRHGASMYA
jgi:hypothetical protein